jgi:hypothetical protein
MDFELPEELADVQKLAHDFAEKESRRAPRNMTEIAIPGESVTTGVVLGMRYSLA